MRSRKRDPSRNSVWVEILVNVIALGIGNVRSVVNWVLQKTDNVRLVTTSSDYEGGTIIIPGVCSSKELMVKIIKTNLRSTITNAAYSNEKIIGICAGFQVLGEYSEEDGGIECLGILPHRNCRMTEVGSDIGVSVNGWDTVVIPFSKSGKARIHDDFPRNRYLRGNVYFNHRYGVLEQPSLDPSDMIGRRGKYISYWMRNNIYGFQFHPEKSGKFGRQLLSVIE